MLPWGKPLLAPNPVLILPPYFVQHQCRRYDVPHTAEDISLGAKLACGFGVGVRLTRRSIPCWYLHGKQIHGAPFRPCGFFRPPCRRRVHLSLVTLSESIACRARLYYCSRTTEVGYPTTNDVVPYAMSELRHWLTHCRSKIVLARNQPLKLWTS